MKSFLEEYGFAILAAIVVILLVVTATPVGDLIKKQISNMIDLFSEKIQVRLNLLDAEENNVRYGVYLHRDGTAHFVAKINASNINPSTSYVKIGNDEIILDTLEKEDNYYLVPLPSVAPPDINDKTTITVYDVRDEVVTSVTTSLADYLYEIIDSTDSEELKDFCKAFLNYGAYAQIAANHNISDLANSRLSEAEKDVSQVSYTDMEGLFIKDGTTEGIGPMNISGVMNKEGIIIKILFTLEEGYNISEFNFTIDDETITPVWDNNNSRYIINFQVKNAPNLDELSTLKIKRGEQGNLSLKVAPLTYAYILLKNYSSYQQYQAVVNWTRSMYLYNITAKKVKNVINIEN